ncbi:MAG: hypothetical protein IB618_02085 [Candidatus Pacearchaeota archaeon]|nr:MAG: hypothetical protein IB618_02085 [Candidatus Pacearchaeota archaeon]
MAKVKHIGKVKGLGEIIRVYAPFDEQLKTLKKAGAKYPISVRDCAYMRINGGSTDSTRTCHAPIYAKKSPIILAMISPLVEDLKMAEKAVQANRNGYYFVTKDLGIYDMYSKFAEEDKNKEPEKRRAVFLPERSRFSIKKGSETAETLFQDVETQYFDKFAQNKITFYPINSPYVDKQKGTVINYLWFGGPGGGSDLGGIGRGLLDDGVLRVFGVLGETGEASSRQQKGLAYNLSDLKNAEKEIARLGKFLKPEQTKNLENLIHKLRQ